MNSHWKTGSFARKLAALMILPGLGLLLLVPSGGAADRYWRLNGFGSGDGPFNASGRWQPGAQVPGAADHAHFTNGLSYTLDWPAGFSATNANALLNAFYLGSNSVVTLNISNSFWLLTNAFLVGTNATATATVSHVTGSLLVTNAAGTGLLNIGSGGQGAFQLNGGNVVADWLLATNNGVGLTNSLLSLSNGSLTTLRGSVLLPPPTNSFAVGRESGSTATWVMLGGSNYVDLVQRTFYLGEVAGSRGVVLVSGTSTVWKVDASVQVGRAGTGSTLIVSNGATAQNIGLEVGYFSSPGSNVAVVTGSGSRWDNASGVTVGGESHDNRLLVLNGATLSSSLGGVGAYTFLDGIGRSNLAVVAGSGSTWTNLGAFGVGEKGAGNQLWITNGGVFANLASLADPFIVGRNLEGSNQLVLVAGGGSAFLSPSNRTIIGQSGRAGRFQVANGGQARIRQLWLGQNISASSNVASVSGFGALLDSSVEVHVGRAGSDNLLTVENGGRVVTSNLVVSLFDTASNNVVRIDGGLLFVTNAARSGTMLVGDGGEGLVYLEAGQMTVDRLWVTNGNLSRFFLQGGHLRTGSLLHSNGLSFNVGTTLLAATLELLPDSTNLFSHGLVIRPKSRLTGRGVIYGSVTNGGGTLSPGAPVGGLDIFGHLELAMGSTNIFEIHPAAGIRDQIAGLASISYGGTLIVTNLGGTLTNGSSFQLFSAAARTGAFQQLVLPPLPPGLAWTNRLLVDGSIAVGPTPPMPYTTLVSFGANWKYLDNGSDQGTAWTAPAFDDSSWFNGLAELGYGDGDEATVVGFGPDANNKYITTYFRHSFTVENPEAIGSLLVRLLRDDGALVYLNGVELLRDNMPAGPVTFTNRAATFIEEFPVLMPIVASVPGTSLIPGTNVLAVEIHQSEAVSSDISFDLEITAVPVNLLPPVTRVWTGGGTNSLWSNPTNWLGHAAPEMGDALVFPTGAARLANTNDFPNGLIIDSLRFETNGYFLSAFSETRLLVILNSLTNAAVAGTNSFALSQVVFINPSAIAILSTGAVLNLSAVIATESLHFQNAGRVEVNAGQGPGALSKSGPGTLLLKNNPLFTGPTTVNEGSLALSGLMLMPLIEVNGGARLAGGATVQNVNVTDGRIAPGDTFDVAGLGSILIVSNLFFPPGPGFRAVELDVFGIGSDQIFVRGTADLTGASLELLVRTNLALGAVRTVITRSDTNAFVTGTFAGLPEGALIPTSNGTLRISYLGGTGQDVTLTRVAVTNVWTGAGTNHLWSNLANWDTTYGPQLGDHLLFPPVAQRVTHHDLPTNNAYTSVTFTAPDYLITGLPLTMSRLQSLQTSGTNRIQVPLILTNIPSLVVEHAAATFSLEGGLRLNSALCLVTNAGGLLLSGGLEGLAAGGLEKWGAGRFEVRSSTLWDGILAVREGAMAALGSYPSVSASLRGGTFYGTGAVQQVSVLSGTLPSRFGAGEAPDRAGRLEVAALVLNSNVTVDVDLLATGHDLIQAGPANFPRLTSATLNLNLGYNPPALAQYRIIENLNANPVFGTFAGLHEGALLTNQGVVFSITYTGGDGNDVVLTRVNSLMNLTSVTPQPGGGSIALAGQGTPGWNFILEAATNLTPPVVWLPVSTNTADTNGVFQFLQSAQTNDPARFYRARAADNP